MAATPRPRLWPLVAGALVLGLLGGIGLGVRLPGALRELSAPPPLQGGYAPSVTVTGLVDAPRAFALDDLQRYPAVEATHRCVEPNGTPHENRFRGVPLWTLLTETRIRRPTGSPLDPLHQYIVATATDAFEAIVPVMEVDPQYNGGPALVAYERAGPPLGDDLGMATLVVPTDRTCERDVYQLGCM